MNNLLGWLKWEGGKHREIYRQEKAMDYSERQK